MKAVFFDRKLNFAQDYLKPVPEKDEALIRVSVTGICNTDLEITKGYGGFKGVIGHEFVGIVEKINGKDQRLIGKRVAGEINIGCGVCDYCMEGLNNHCPDRKVLGIVNKDGALAEYITLPVSNLFEVPETVSDEEAVFTEPLAAGFEIIEQIHIKPDSKILVMGDGKLGLLISLVLNLQKADVTLLGKHREKLKIIEKRKIKTILLEDLDIRKQYDIVVEATGSADGFEAALQLVKPRGIVVLKSTVTESKQLNLSPVVIDEITIVGSRCGPFEPALEALSNKLVDVRPLITAVYPFDRAQEAFVKAREKESLKVILDFRK